MPIETDQYCQTKGLKGPGTKILTVVGLLDQSHLPRNENAKDNFRLRIRGLRVKSLISLKEWYQGVNSASKCFLKAHKCSRNTFPVITDVFWTKCRAFSEILLIHGVSGYHRQIAIRWHYITPRALETLPVLILTLIDGP